MSTMTIKDLDKSTDLERAVMAGIQGGRMKIPGQHGYGTILTSADGDPVGVYVDGVLQNSTTTGYYHL